MIRIMIGNMIRTLMGPVLLGTVLLGAAISAAAAEPGHPTLKPEATVTGDLVRIGDLIENAGIVANVPIFRAPDLGSTGSVPAAAVLDAVRPHALIGVDTAGITAISVTRASRTIPAKDVEDVVAEALSRQFALGQAKDIAVTFERELRSIQVEPSSKGQLRINRLTYEARTGHFEATVEVPTNASNRGLLRLAGRATATVEIVTLVRPLDRGAIIKTADLVSERHPRAEVGRDVIADMEQIVGFAARNTLQPGRLLRAGDLMKPELVARNETVTLIYEVPGIVLTVRGKAAEGGAEGDVISVLNEQSKRTVQGVVSGPGRVTVSVNSPRLAANIAASEANGR